eukprot:COSAG05_NODE_525_length_8961_cov_212.374591_4_plen_118_part_00
MVLFPFWLVFVSAILLVRHALRAVHGDDDARERYVMLTRRARGEDQAQGADPAGLRGARGQPGAGQQPSTSGGRGDQRGYDGEAAAGVAVPGGGGGAALAAGAVVVSKSLFLKSRGC